MKATIKNNSKAPQGVHTEGGVVFIDAGKQRTLDVLDTYVERLKALPFLAVSFPTAAEPDEDPAPAEDAPAGEAAEAPAADPMLAVALGFDAMSDDDLRAFIAQRDGRAPHPNTGRDKLLAKANGGQSE